MYKITNASECKMNMFLLERKSSGVYATPIYMQLYHASVSSIPHMIFNNFFSYC